MVTVTPHPVPHQKANPGKGRCRGSERAIADEDLVRPPKSPEHRAVMKVPVSVGDAVRGDVTMCAMGSPNYRDCG